MFVFDTLMYRCCMTETPARSARREATRQRILDAAVSAFADRGFYGTSVEDICERAGFTRGAFYSNFSSRDDLFLELYRRHGEELTAYVEEVAARSDLSPADLLLAVIDGWESRSTQRQRWHLLQSEFALHALRDPEAGRGYAATQAAVRSRLGEAIRDRLARDGLTVDVPVDQLVRLCLAVTLQSTTQHLLEPKAQPLGELERLFLPRLLETLIHRA